MIDTLVLTFNLPPANPLECITSFLQMTYLTNRHSKIRPAKQDREDGGQILKVFQPASVTSS